MDILYIHSLARRKFLLPGIKHARFDVSNRLDSERVICYYIKWSGLLYSVTLGFVCFSFSRAFSVASWSLTENLQVIEAHKYT